jgi:ribosomal protein S1
MDIRVGEKVTGVIEEIRDEGYLVSLCNEVKGFAPEDSLLDDVKESEVNEGSEAKVRIDKKKEEGHFRVTLIKIFSKDNFQEKPDKYLKKVSHEKQNGGEKSEEPEISEELEEWFSELDRTLDEIRENRKERLDVDFWTV